MIKRFDRSGSPECALEVGNAWRELEAEQGAERKDVVGIAAAIGVVAARRPQPLHPLPPLPAPKQATLRARTGTRHLRWPKRTASRSLGLYGAFLQIAAESADAEKLSTWEAKGQRSLQTAENDNRVVAIATFAAKPSGETAAALRKLGFRWNSILGQFEGKIVYDEAEAFVGQAGGTLNRVAAATD
jgi:hypothetical protein